MRIAKIAESITILCFLQVLLTNEVLSKKQNNKKKSRAITKKLIENINKNKIQICKLADMTSVLHERKCRLPDSACVERITLEDERGHAQYKLSFCQTKANVLNVDTFVVSLE